MSQKYPHLPRPRIQRAFVRWFRENRTRFVVPVRLTKTTAAGILLNFPRHPDCLEVWLSRWSLAVHVDWQGFAWDMVMCLDCIPETVPGGYRCHLTTEFIPIFRTREALWRYQLFEPFLLWVNMRLACASRLTLFGKPGGSTWARLTSEYDDCSDPECLWLSIPFQNVPSSLPAVEPTCITAPLEPASS